MNPSDVPRFGSCDSGRCKAPRLAGSDRVTRLPHQADPTRVKAGHPARRQQEGLVLPQNIDALIVLSQQFIGDQA